MFYVPHLSRYCRLRPSLGSGLVLLAMATASTSQCEVLPAPGLPPGVSTRLLLQEPQGFEEQRTPAGPAQYLWTNRRGAASLSMGGNVVVGTLAGSPIRISFLGANPLSEPSGELKLERKANYYFGSERSWREESYFARVRYSEIYPGIDLVLVTTSGQLEYNFEIAPHADPSVVRIHYEGASVFLSSEGNLELNSPGINIVQLRPLGVQKKGTDAVAVTCMYHLAGHNEVVLKLGEYNHEATLLIDPVLTFSTYVGGSGFDQIDAIANDSSGNLYIVGNTSSGSLWNNTLRPRSSRDVFVAKLNSTATAVLYTTYLGGSGNDFGRAIAVDASGNAYLAGSTGSADFPITAGAFATSETGRENAFVAKLDATGRIQYSTYLGGAVLDSGVGIAIDSSGAAYIAGQTASPTFPITNGAFQSRFGGGSDCFIAKLNASGSALLYSTFLGGSKLDACNGIALDSTANAYVTGVTYSINFPSISPLQALNGTANAFISKINAAGTALVYSTLVGGSNVDGANAIAVDASGSAYVTGSTSSIDFPVTAGAFQRTLNGTYNAFVLKLAANGAALSYSTLLGGSVSDTATSIAVGSTGRALVGGYTSSPDFPMLLAVQPNFVGAFDAFATVVDALGASVVFSSYLGGSGDDRAYAVALIGTNSYLAGFTASSNFPTIGAIQPALNVAYDAFLLELSGIGANPLLSISKTHAGGVTQGQQNAAYTVTVSNAGNAPATTGTVTVTDTLPPGLTLVSMSGTGWSCAAGWCSRSDALAGGMTYPVITVTVNVSSNATSPQVNSVSVSGGGSPPATATDSTIIGTAQGADLALNMTATQSSTYTAGRTDASRAVDGSTDGLWGDGLVSCTGYTANAWWQVDLGASASVSTVVVWNRTDCCGNALSDYWVFVSNTPFGPNDTPATLQNRAATFSSHQTVQPNPSATITIPGAQGRYVRVQLSGTNFLTLAEVQVFGSLQSAPDLALNMKATQSSTYAPGTTDASRAVDGSTDGLWGDGLVSCTFYTANAWWQVDLGASASVSTVVVWNRTDCCGNALSDYWVFVSNTPFGPNDTPATLQNRAATFSSHQTVQPNPSATITIPGAQGRYVRVQLSGTNFLTLAEVQVFGSLQSAPDLALNMKATQSSTYAPGTTDASRAVDGSTDGLWGDGLVSCTFYTANAWWQVDLGASASVSTVVVWNRTDCCGNALSDYWVFVSNTPFGPNDTPATLQNRAATFSSHQTVQPNPSATITIPGAQGRYVRVQLNGTNFLTLAEVQVFGP